MKLFTKTLIIFPTVLFLTACATTGSVDNLGITNAVALAPKGDVAQIVFKGRGENLGETLGGLLKKAKQTLGTKSEQERLEAFHQVNNIDTGEIVTSAFNAEVKARGNFITVPASSPVANARLFIDITDAGLAVNSTYLGFSPFIKASARMVNSEEEVLWSRVASYGGAIGELEYKTFSAWMNDPAGYRQMMTQAAEHLARSLVTSLVPNLEEYKDSD